MDEQPGPDLAAVYAPGAPAARVALVTPTPDAEVTAFAEWLRTSDADVALAAAGLRNVTGTTWPEGLERAGLTPADVSPTGRPNTSAELEQVAAFFSLTRTRSSTLTVMDISGSMGAPFPGTDKRRVDMITEASIGSFELYPPGTRSGLMTFNADQKLVPHIQVVVPLLFNTDPRWAELAPQFAQSLATIPVGGGTPLYQAILNGYLYALEEFDPTITNRMIVLTDGKDEAARGVIDEPTLNHPAAGRTGAGQADLAGPGRDRPGRRR